MNMIASNHPAAMQASNQTMLSTIKEDLAGDQMDGWKEMKN